MARSSTERPTSRRDGEAITAEPYFEIDARRGRRDRRLLGVAAAGAMLAHAALLMLRGPELDGYLAAVEDPELFVVRPIRFVQPPPEPVAPEPRPIEPRRETDPVATVAVPTVPVPDPTPTEPIPVEALVSEAPIVRPPADSVADLAPPVPPDPEENGPVWVGHGMTPPVRRHAPPPRYTEIARRVRLEGRVVLQAVIDKRGEVTSVRVLAGLGLGLDQAAVEAIRSWRFDPAQLADGRPVAVYYTLTVSFRLE